MSKFEKVVLLIIFTFILWWKFGDTILAFFNNEPMAWIALVPVVGLILIFTMTGKMYNAR